MGQGSLYRHFADRFALASAVLDENVQQIERAGAEPGASLKGVLGVVTWHLTRSTAFVDLLRVRGDGEQARALSERVRSVLAGCLPAGHRLSADDVMLAVAMVSGAVAAPPRRNGSASPWRPGNCSASRWGRCDPARRSSTCDRQPPFDWRMPLASAVNVKTYPPAGPLTVM